MRLKRFLLASALALSFSVTAAGEVRADPITAAIVGTIFTAGTTAAAVATFVVNSVLYAGASWALGKASRALGKSKSAVQERQASVLQLTVGEVPREMAFGHTCSGGSLIDAYNHGGQYGTDHVTRIIALADHAIDGLYGFYVDDQFFSWSGDGQQPAFEGKLAIEFRNATGDPVDLPTVASAGGWGVTDKLIGVTHVWVTHTPDDKVFPQGHPQLRFSFRGLRVYDPRKDAALGYAGPNPHVWEDRSTHEFTQNATLNRYAFVRGVYAEGHQGEPAYLLIGRGLSAEEAPPERIIAAANLCDEEIEPGQLRYLAAGVIRASDDWGQVENWFADAMAGVIVQHEGGIEIEPGQAKAAVVTITDADLVLGEPIHFAEFLTDEDGGRLNTVVPRYVEPAQNFADHSGPVRRDLDDIAEDGGPREDTLPLPFVTVGGQADRCCEIKRRLSRLERRATIVLPPRFVRLEEGDWIAWQSDRRHGGATRRYRIESWSRGKDWRMRLSLREIAASVYGQPDPIEDTAATPAPPVPVDALGLPGAGAEAILLPGDSSVIPAIRFTWDMPVDGAMRAIRGEVRVFGDTDVSTSRTEDLTLGDGWVTTNGVTPEQTLQARLVPIGDPTRPVLPSSWFTVTTGTLIAQPPGDLGDSTPPAVPTGLTLSSTSVADPSTGNPVVTISASWDANIETDLDGYDVEIQEAAGPKIVRSVRTAADEWIGRTGVVYSVRVRARDRIGNLSAWTTVQTVVGAGDTTPPSAPTSFTAEASLGSIFLRWVNASESDLDAVEIWSNTSNTTSGATRIGIANALPSTDGGFTVSGLTSGVTRYFWLKSVDTSGNASGFSSGASATTALVGDGDIAVNSLSGNRVVAGSLHADRVTAGTLTGDRFDTGTSLPGTITVGVTGVSIGTMETRAGDPAARINTQTTRITPGLIQVSGATSLSDWRGVSDTTRINGGAVEADSIVAQALRIGQRGFEVVNNIFAPNSPGTNYVGWSGGGVAYVDDAGAPASVGISGGNALYTGSLLYIYWTKGGSTFQSTTSYATANSASSVIIATYDGGVNLNTYFGRTVITPDGIQTPSLAAITATLGTVTAGKVQDTAATTFLDLVNSRAQFRRGSFDLRLGSIGTGVALWYGSTAISIGSESRTNGVWAFGDDGVVYYGSTVLTPGDAGPKKTLTTFAYNTTGTSFQNFKDIPFSGVPAGTQVVELEIDFQSVATSIGGNSWIGQVAINENNGDGSEPTLGAYVNVEFASGVLLVEGRQTDTLKIVRNASKAGAVSYRLYIKDSGSVQLYTGGSIMLTVTPSS